MSAKKSKRAKEARRHREALRQKLDLLSDDELTNMFHETKRDYFEKMRTMHEARARVEMIESITRLREVTRPMNGTTIRISDHAVVRFLERHEGLDVSAIRDRIAVMAARAKAAGQPDDGGPQGGWPEYKTRVHDDESGLTMGMTDRNIVTTVFTPREEAIIELNAAATETLLPCSEP